MSARGPAARPLDWARGLTADGWLLFAACGMRSCAYGFLSVVLGLYLAALGLEPGAIGVLFAVALAGSAAMTLILTGVADRVGRRRILALGAALMALAGAVFATTDHVLVLAAAAMVGTISPSGKDVGPFLSVEQAVLPQTTRDEHRTSVFAAYNLVGAGAGALGALVAGLPDLLGLAPLAGYRALLWAYALAALGLLGLFARLSPAVEVAHTAPSPSGAAGPAPGRARGLVLRLAVLFGLDAFAGGFIVQGLVAYWFHLRFGVEPAALGLIFFGANALAALSFVAAAPLARRIGLLNTMVFAHLPSNVLLLLVPLMPTVELAAGVFLLRHLSAQMDVPTRQSYVMAILPPGERAAAAGVLAVARTAATATAPALAGATLAAPALGLPFLVAGGLKIAYDLAIWAAFRHVRPPEEAARLARPPAPSPAAQARGDAREDTG